MPLTVIDIYLYEYADNQKIRRQHMAPLLAAKQTGKEIVIAVSTTIGSCINWFCRGKQQALQRATMGQIVCSLEDCLRKIEIELLRVTALSPARTQELKAEKNKLLAEIDALSLAAGLRSRRCSTNFQ
jgi:hypothetical protein